MAFSHWDEAAGSPVMDITPTGRRAVRTGYVDGAYVSELINYVLPIGNFGVAYPDNSLLALRATQMHIEPRLGDDQPVTSPATSNLDFDTLNAHAEYKVTITYETQQADAQQNEDPQLLMTHRWSCGGEAITMPNYGLEWDDGGAVDDEVKAGRIIPLFEHHITWPRVENPPFAVIRDRIGTVNDAIISWKTGLIAPETLLFIGAELQRDILVDGTLAWQLGYHFSERRVDVLTVDTSYTSQATCVADGGIWNSITSKCGILTIGGWNHFFRSEKRSNATSRVDGQKGKDGFYRLRTKPIVDPSISSQATCTAAGGFWDTDLQGTNKCVISGRDPIYRLTSFDELFAEAA